ncbi:MAG: hypothetical protein R3311_19020, partial [Oceanisphaera sp.]|nr:hypothetical protein [Oceanisphaera sp.]
MSTQILLVLVPVLPLLLALLAPLLRSAVPLILAPVMALLASLLIPVDSSVYLPWLLTGTYWQLDSIGQMFLLFSSMVWLVVTLYVVFADDTQMRQPVYRCLFMLA